MQKSQLTRPTCTGVQLYCTHGCLVTDRDVFSHGTGQCTVWCTVRVLRKHVTRCLRVLFGFCSFLASSLQDEGCCAFAYECANVLQHDEPPLWMAQPKEMVVDTKSQTFGDREYTVALSDGQRCRSRLGVITRGRFANHVQIRCGAYPNYLQSHG